MLYSVVKTQETRSNLLDLARAAAKIAKEAINMAVDWHNLEIAVIGHG